MTATPDYLASVALELSYRVREDNPEANGAWLAKRLPDPADWFRLAFVAAAAIPQDRTWRELTEWASGYQHQPEGQRRLKPCGTLAAAARHRYHREPLCPPCKAAYRERDRQRKAARTAARKATA